MAETTYKIIKRTEYENRGGAPVYIDTSEVLKSDGGETVMKLKLYNNGAKTVRSVYFNAGCFDENLSLCVQLKNIPYINVDAAPDSAFGETRAVEVPDGTCSVFAEVSKILFEDGSSWVNPKQSLAENITSESELGYDALRLRLTKQIKEKSNEKTPRRKMISGNKKIAIACAVTAAVIVLIMAAAHASRYISQKRETYNSAMNLFINHDYAAAAEALSAADSDYRYFGGDYKEINYSAAVAYMNISDYENALKYFQKCGDYKRSITNMRKILDAESRLIAAGYNHSAAARKDGTVAAFGDNSYGQCNTADWSKIIGVAAGGNHTVGMTYDGMLFACGDNSYGQCDVGGWTDIVSVKTGESHTAALKVNGRVIARGNNQYGQCDVQEWTDIVQIAAAGNHTIGLTANGTVLAAGWNDHGQCDAAGETDVLYIATGDRNTVLVKYDGSVKVYGDNSYSQLDTAGIKNVLSAAVGLDYIVYADSDGRVKSRGNNGKNQGSVSLWLDVLAVNCGNNHTLGLSAGGGIYAVGDDGSDKLKITELNDIGAENIPVNE